jgi:nitrogen fixation NifU-like protein
MHGKLAPAGVDLGDLEALEGVQKFAVRVKCAMLPWVTLADALRAWRTGGAEATSTTEQELGR